MVPTSASRALTTCVHHSAPERAGSKCARREWNRKTDSAKRSSAVRGAVSAPTQYVALVL